jgi:hypothetical protein
MEGRAKGQTVGQIGLDIMIGGSSHRCLATFT